MYDVIAMSLSKSSAFFLPYIEEISNFFKILFSGLSIRKFLMRDYICSQSYLVLVHMNMYVCTKLTYSIFALAFSQ